MQLSREGYKDLIQLDIQEIEKSMPDSLVRKHIIAVLQSSINTYYTEDETAVIKDVIEVYGVDHQLDMADEELGELLQKINKIRRSFTVYRIQEIKNGAKFHSVDEALTYCGLCSEIADVKIIVKQLEHIFSSAHVSCSEERKLARLRNTVNKKIKELSDKTSH